MSVHTPILQLASKSPRRREILDQIGIRYEVVTAPIVERAKLNEQADDLVIRLAEEKAKAGFAASPLAPTLGSDTIVVLDNQVFGKPADLDESLRMLRSLSNVEHRVMTAVALYDGASLLHALSISKVKFRSIGDEEIRRYWQTREPCDKAGSYAIQGKGAVFVESMQGSYSGVMGLPIYETAQLLAKLNISCWL